MESHTLRASRERMVNRVAFKSAEQETSGRRIPMKWPGSAKRRLVVARSPMVDDVPDLVSHHREQDFRQTAHAAAVFGRSCRISCSVDLLESRLG
jgi:hypothetical protein